MPDTETTGIRRVISSMMSRLAVSPNHRILTIGSTLVALLLSGCSGSGNETTDAASTITTQQAFERMLSAAKPCDEGFKGWADGMQQGGRDLARVIELLGQAKDLQRICEAASTEINDIPEPALPSAQLEQWKGAMSSCWAVHYHRAQALTKLTDGFADNPTKATVDYGLELHDVPRSATLCVAGLFVAASAAKQPIKPPEKAAN